MEIFCVLVLYPVIMMVITDKIVPCNQNDLNAMDLVSIYLKSIPLPIKSVSCSFWT